MLINFFFLKKYLILDSKFHNFFFNRCWVLSSRPKTYMFRKYVLNRRIILCCDENCFTDRNYNLKIWNYKIYKNFIFKNEILNQEFICFKLIQMFKMLNAGVFIFNFDNFVLFYNIFFKKKKSINLFSTTQRFNLFSSFNVKFL